MQEESSTPFEVQEIDSDGKITTTFAYDAITKSLQMRKRGHTTLSGSSLVKKCMDPFLPAGYPASVTSDYILYQIYDSIQAFASTIAGLLASRAVFVGMGVGSEDASLVTTMLLYIAQETVGRFATILFAHQFSQIIEVEVKFYRFFADIVNDTAFVLDCLSPNLPVPGRVLTLCVSNACRAVCGVCGGSSKAILSAHFAKEGNLGELSAKDGSQETVVSLIAMWFGGFVVSKVHGTLATWCCLIPLLVFHLWANFMAVKSVRLTSLNLERSSILFAARLSGRVLTPDEVGKQETILRYEKILPSSTRPCRVGVGVNEFLEHLPGPVSNDSQKYFVFTRLWHLFRDEDYVLWKNTKTRQTLVLLKDTATNGTQAKALCHSERLRASWPESRMFEQDSEITRNQEESFANSRGDSAAHNPIAQNKLGVESSSSSTLGSDMILSSISRTLQENRDGWKALQEELSRAGWHIELTNIVGGRGYRITAHEQPAESKKGQ